MTKIYRIKCKSFMLFSFLINIKETIEIMYNYFKENMTEEKISQKLIDEVRNYFLEELKDNYLVSKNK